MKEVNVVYKGTHIDTNEFYIGSHRTKAPVTDFGSKYKTSSKRVRELGFSNFKWEILHTYENHDQCWWYEQALIKENIKNPLCINKHYIDPDSGKSKFSTAGCVLPPRSDEHVRRLSDSLKGKQSGNKNPNFGKKHTAEIKEKMCRNHADVSGEKNPNFGKIASEETRRKIGSHMTEERRKKISQGKTGKPATRPIVSCPHCGKSGNISPIKRWHFNNCRNKTE